MFYYIALDMDSNKRYEIVIPGITVCYANRFEDVHSTAKEAFIDAMELERFHALEDGLKWELPESITSDILRQKPEYEKYLLWFTIEINENEIKDIPLGANDE